MKLYYYKTAQGNFGDDINGWLWRELAPDLWDDDASTLVSGIGTIIGEEMPMAAHWIVMSSGTGYASLPEKSHRCDWNIICVRGPLTARLLELEPDKAVTDGAILVSLLPEYQPVPENERSGIAFMPHHAQTLKLGQWREVCRRSGIVFLDPREDSKTLLHKIRHSKMILASAMHAAILADAVRVPWLPLEISSETSSFKWLDWTLSMGLPYRPVVMPPSSLLESLHSRLLLLLGLNHTFPDLSAEGALRHASLLRVRENFLSDAARNLIGKSFKILGIASKLPVIKPFYVWLNRRRMARATAALCQASRKKPMLSDENIFIHKKYEMERRLSILKSYAAAKPVSNTPALAAENNITPSAPTRHRLIPGHAINTLLRCGSLASKLLLTFYMGRYLGLAEMGTYGLITACVAVLVTLLGVRFDYVVSRDIVDASPLTVARKIRDQSLFYGVNYLVLAVLLGGSFIVPLKGINAEILLFTLILSILESFAAITSGNFVSLKRPVLANVLFFIRAALWVIPVIGLGVMFPKFRTAETILFWWTSGVLISLAVTFAAWRDLPWHQALRSPVDWVWIKSGVGKCFPIWLGVIGGTAATYVDRFVVEHYLGLDYVGIASFYGSFVLAIQSLLQSGIFAFSFPRLVSHHRQNQYRHFRKEISRMTVQATLFAGVMALGIGIIVPLLGDFFHRPEFTQYASTLWLMLLAVWLRSTTEGLYYVLYAQHQDRLIWIGGLLMLVPAFVCNIIFVPLAGFKGIGYSAIAVSAFLCVWRIYSVTRSRPQHIDTAIVNQVLS